MSLSCLMLWFFVLFLKMFLIILVSLRKFNGEWLQWGLLCSSHWNYIPLHMKIVALFVSFDWNYPNQFDIQLVMCKISLESMISNIAIVWELANFTAYAFAPAILVTFDNFPKCSYAFNFLIGVAKWRSLISSGWFLRCF